MKTTLPVNLLLAATALCQTPGYQSATYPRLRPTDGSDLYQRLIASDYVVVGKVSKVESPDERLSTEEKARRLKEIGLGVEFDLRRRLLGNHLDGQAKDRR